MGGELTHRERMLRAMRGEAVDEIPWAPRMDLWYIAQRERGSLPDEVEGLNTVEIAKHFGFACHAVQADYTISRPTISFVFRGLGFDTHPDYPYHVEIDGLPVGFSIANETVTTQIETSRGPVSYSLRQSASMRREGISLPFVISYPVEELEDLDRVAEIFEHLLVVSTPGSYGAFRDRIGDQGVAIARGCVAASPMHLLLHELMPMDKFFYWYHDHYRQLRAFCERISPFFENVLQAVETCDAEAVLWGSNFDRDLTWPPFFHRDIAPWLKKARERLHKHGKLLVCHTDGENSGLFDAYRECPFDVAESVCPAPMTELSLIEIRRRIGSRIALWGGVPSVALLADSFSQEEFRRYVDDLIAALPVIAPGNTRLVLGVSDNVPPDADFSRLAAIGEALHSNV